MPYQQGLETLTPAFPDRPIPYITHGTSFASLCASAIPSTLGATRAYILCSTSISNTPNLAKLTHALEHAGISVVGVRTGFAPHTRWNQVVSCAADAASKQPDVLITLGAGSLTDGCKVIAWMLANNVTTSEGLERMYADAPGDDASALKPPTIRQVAIPTSLSGGEYQSIAGVTRDDGSNRKLLFDPPAYNPALVVLDPDLCRSTPERIWLSTGVRAIDHCIETLCSLQSNEKGDAEAEKGLKRLVPSLIRTRKDPDDLDARFESMLGVIEAMSAVGSGVPLGASHAIGHQLGPLGVGHGETSCIMLPAVCKWNAAQNANNDRQAYCVKLLLSDTLVHGLVAAKFSDPSKADLGDILDVIFRELGMPRTLNDVGVCRDQMENLAENSLSDTWIRTNAKKIERKEEVMEILEMVVQ